MSRGQAPHTANVGNKRSTSITLTVPIFAFLEEQAGDETANNKSAYIEKLLAEKKETQKRKSR